MGTSVGAVSRYCPASFLVLALKGAGRSHSFQDRAFLLLLPGWRRQLIPLGAVTAGPVGVLLILRITTPVSVCKQQTSAGALCGCGCGTAAGALLGVPAPSCLALPHPCLPP